MEDEYNIVEYPPLDPEGDVTDGSVDYYDFDWGEEVRPQDQPGCPGGCDCAVQGSQDYPITAI